MVICLLHLYYYYYHRHHRDCCSRFCYHIIMLSRENGYIYLFIYFASIHGLTTTTNLLLWSFFSHFYLLDISFFVWWFFFLSFILNHYYYHCYVINVAYPPSSSCVLKMVSNFSLLLPYFFFLNINRTIDYCPSNQFHNNHTHTHPF